MSSTTATSWADYEDSLSARSSLAEPIEASARPDARLHFPRSIGVGVAWRPKPLLRIAFDVTYDQWTEFLLDGAAGLPDRIRERRSTGCPPS